jgi:hypothetical protein
MATNLTVFADSGDSRSYVLDDHTVALPRLLIQKRRVPVGSQTMAEVSFAIVNGTTDPSEAVPATEVPNVNFTLTVRYPYFADTADRDDALALLRDMVASDEFAASIASQKWLTADA